LSAEKHAPHLEQDTTIEVRTLVVPEDVESQVSDKALRLDKVLATLCAGVMPPLSRTRLQELIKAGHVYVEGQCVTDIKGPIKAGMSVQIHVPEAIDANPIAQPIALKVVYEDEALIVIDKPAGLVVHPAAGHADGTLVNALIHHCGDTLSGIGGVKRPGIVHRLDRDTTGLLVVAKTDHAHQHLSAQFADHGRTGPLHRAYIALVWGEMGRSYGTIDAALERDRHVREKIAVVPARAPAERGKYAMTHWRLRNTYAGLSGEVQVSEVVCQLETGRTHQIRVHMTHIGHPLLGDPTYGAGFVTKIKKLSLPAQECLSSFKRQALHAAELGFEHPVTGEVMHFESPLPDDMQQLVSALSS
jgi:23S rRNA pseudouridine1911/1915/1917 synthase